MTSCLPPTFTPQNRDEVFIHLLSFIEVVEKLFRFRDPPPGGVMNLKIGSAAASYDLRKQALRKMFIYYTTCSCP